MSRREFRESFEYLMDGIAPDVGPGDTVYLCAGRCDGKGIATYHLDATGTNRAGDAYVFDPHVSGRPSAPITICAYHGETVILSGDSNANGVNDSTDVGTLLTNDTEAGRGKGWYVWKNLIFERSKTVMMNLRGGPDNWTFDHIEIRFTGRLWKAVDLYDARGSRGSHPHYAMEVAGATGRFTVKNSRFHHIDGFAHRNVVNPNLDLALFENNEYYNLCSVNNDFIGKNFTWRNNYAHDVECGWSIEEDMQNVVIEDNTFACLGEYKVTSDGRCSNAISVNNGDMGGGNFTTRNITKADRERLKPASRSLLTSLHELVSPMPAWTQNVQTQAEVRVFILDSLWQNLPRPPYSDQDCEVLANRVYDHVWSQCVAGSFAA